MSPALHDGDWLLVDPDAYGATPARPGQLVLAESASGPLVKRVGGTSGDGVVHLVGDAPSDSEHRHDVTIPVSAISGRPWFRYWPPSRIGRVS